MYREYRGFEMAVNQRDLVKERLDEIILGLLEKEDKFVSALTKEIDLQTSGQAKVPAASINSKLKKLEERGFVAFVDCGKNGKIKKLYSITEMGREYYTKKKAEYEYERTITDKLLSTKQTNLSALPPKTKKPSRAKKVLQNASTIEVDFDNQQMGLINAIEEQNTTNSTDIVNVSDLDFTKNIFGDTNNTTISGDIADYADNTANFRTVAQQGPSVQNETIYNTNTTNVYHFTSNFSQNEPNDSRQNYDATPPIVESKTIAENEPYIKPQIDDIKSGEIFQDLQSKATTNSYVDNQQTQEFETEVVEKLDVVDDFGGEWVDNSWEYAGDILESNHSLTSPSFDDTAFEKTATHKYEDVALYTNNYVETSPIQQTVLASDTILQQQQKKQQLLDIHYKTDLLALIKPFTPTIIKKYTKRVVEQPIHRTIRKTDSPTNIQQYSSNIVDTNLSLQNTHTDENIIDSQSSKDDLVAQKPNFTMNENIANPHYHFNLNNEQTFIPPNATAQEIHTTHLNDQFARHSNVNQNSNVAGYQSHTPTTYNENKLVRPFKPKVKSEYKKNHYYLYRLKATQFTILALIMIVEIVLTFLVVFALNYTQSGQMAYYGGAIVLAVALPIYARIQKYNNSDTTKRYYNHFRYNMIFSIGIFVTLSIIALLLNLIIDQMPLNDFSNNVTSVFLPIVLATNVPINCIIFYTLYKTGKYSVV